MRLYRSQSVSGWIIISIAAVSFLFHAYSTGITGKTLKNGNGCECHSLTPFSEVSVVISGPDSLAPGEQALFTVTITGGELIRGGTNIAASNGVLSPFSTDLRFEADELTHVEPKMPDSGAVTFQFNYTAPLTAGTETLFANGNSVNFNGQNTGDKWNFAANKLITVTSPQATFPLSVNILNGWNMVSIPGLHPQNQNVATWWVNKDPNAGVFKFNAGYQAVTAAVPGTGYWMKHNGAQTYNTGDEWPAGILVVPHIPINGLSGWNLIGGYEDVVSSANITTTPPGLISGSLFKYQGGYIPASTIEPGYGYWIKLTSAGQINIPPGNGISGTSPQKVLYDGLGKIIITDNSGRSAALYSAVEETNLNDFDLPPLPPEGMFDIRYSSGRYAERLNIKHEIQFSGIQYPLNIKAEGTPLLIFDESGKQYRVNDGEAVSVKYAQKLYLSEVNLPDGFSLGQNYPNPFNPSTTIEFSIPEDVSNVKLIIYNALGEKIAEMINTSLTAGSYNVSWDASVAASGMYIYQLVAGSYISTKKMVLLK